MKFSIIMPVYNGEKYIAKSIQSVLAQLCVDWELIIIDDGSTDNSYNIIQEYVKKDSRIHCHKQKNSGVSQARNEGIKLAVGEFILFLDVDDEIEMKTLEVIRDAIDEYDCDIVTYNMIRIDTQSKYLGNFTTPFSETILCIENETDKREYIYSALCSNRPFGFISNYAVKRSLISNMRFKNSMVMCEDLIFDIEMYSKASKILCLPEYFYRYRENVSGAVCNFNGKKIEDLKVAFEAKNALIKKYSLDANYPLIVQWFCGTVIYAYLGLIHHKKLAKSFLCYVKKDDFIVQRFVELENIPHSADFPSPRYIFGNCLVRNTMRIYTIFKQKAKKYLKG